jgi:large subunit ribosomal protein L23
VHPQATKTQIRHAIEEIFKVNVLRVNTVHVRGKKRTFARKGRRLTGKTSDYKKAIVKIKAGQKIELGGVNYFEQ